MNIEIVRLDDSGRGIGYIGEKIIFVPKTLPGDILDAKITLEKKKYSEGKLIEIIKPSDLRKDAKCPYFNKCGGCDYLNLSYENSLKVKVDNFKNNLKRNNIDVLVDVIKNENELNYRNKISLKIEDGKIGFYEKLSKTLVEINYCYLANEKINEYIKEIEKLNIKNGSITIKVNNENKLLLVINTKDKIDIKVLDLCSVEGIILNDNVIYGNYYLMDKVNDLNFEVSYNSFFQVNPFINSEVIKLISDNITKEDIVLDLYSGVGLLSLGASISAKKVYGIEIVKDAVINARNNALINNIDNTEFIIGDLNKSVKIKDKINTIIVDPPRSGMGTPVKEAINKILPNKIIYMSCNPNTLIRDLNELKDIYEIKNITALDMFSYTYHLESIVLLIKK